MTASQNNFRKSRRFTFIALTLGLVSTAAVCAALFQVDQLERDYGTIRADIKRFNNERVEALTRRDGVLSEISQRSVEADGIRKTIADLAAQRDRLDAEIKQQTASLEQGASKLRVDQEQAKVAADTIAQATNAEKKLSTLRSQNVDLEKGIAANQTRLDQSNADVDKAEAQQRAADDAAAASEKSRRDKEAEVSKLNQQLQDLDDRERQVADLTARQSALTQQIAKATKEIGDKQRASQDLDASISKLQDQASKAKIAAAKTDADLTRQESDRNDLANQVSALETQKSTLTGDLTSLTAAAERARSEASAADGRLKAAQDGLAEAEKLLPDFKAQLNDVQADVAAATTKRDALKNEIVELQAVKSRIIVDKADANRAEAEKGVLEKAVVELTARQAELAKELSLRQGDLNNVKSELADLNGRKGVLIQEIASLSDEKVPKQTEVAPSARAEEAPATTIQPAKP